MTTRDSRCEEMKESLTANDIGRRDVLRTGVIAAGLAATASALSLPASAQPTTPPGGKAMTYGIKPLAIDPKSIKGIRRRCSSATTRTTTSAQSSD
jgi:hypothetical protein